MLLTGSGTLEFLEVFNHLITLPCSVSVGINRDLLSEEVLEYYRELKNSTAFQIVFELNRNLSGYSRDVHGQLNIIRNSKAVYFGG